MAKDTETDTHICPRCRVNMAGLGTSRLDSKTHICTPCNNQEAMEDLFGNLTPRYAWPLDTKENN